MVAYEGAARSPRSIRGCPFFLSALMVYLKLLNFINQTLIQSSHFKVEIDMRFTLWTLSVANTLKGISSAMISSGHQL